MAEDKEKVTEEVAEKKSAKNKTVGFSKLKILSLKRYRNRIDLLKVLLDEEKTYTFAQVDAIIEKFMKGRTE